ncbi:MAG: hypothetical protein K2N41_01535 [Lachnospiraceae bacterium]|nr:hypothetical protein [Lachnospiraceae bacterium]MDE7238378.1 hypothetical protein [Lachnospiraceae bacterium]
MSREVLKDLIDMISDNDIDTIFKVLIRFVPEDVPFPDEIEAIEKANRSIVKEGTVSHDAIDWD